MKIGESRVQVLWPLTFDYVTFEPYMIMAFPVGQTVGQGLVEDDISSRLRELAEPAVKFVTGVAKQHDVSSLGYIGVTIFGVFASAHECCFVIG